MRDSFVFYRSFADAVSCIPSAEDKAALMDAIIAYALDGVEPELSGYLLGYFRLIRPQIDANNAKFLNGKKGGRPPIKKPNQNQTITKPKPKHNQAETIKKPNGNQNITNTEPNVNDNDNVNDNVNEFKTGVLNVAHTREDTTTAFAPFPKSPEEIMKEGERQGMPWTREMAETFLSWNGSRGWMTSGGVMMADWRKALRAWYNKENCGKPPQGKKFGSKQVYGDTI